MCSVLNIEDQIWITYSVKRYFFVKLKKIQNRIYLVTMLCQIELNYIYFHSKVAKDIGTVQPESAINPAAVLETGNLNNSNLEFTSKDLGRISGDHRSDRSSSTEGPDSSVHSTSSRSQC
jgi:hypothetical protein